MFNRDRWKEILEVLTKNGFRTLLTAFGVFWGIFILLLLLAAGLVYAFRPQPVPVDFVRSTLPQWPTKTFST